MTNVEGEVPPPAYVTYQREVQCWPGPLAALS